jgi:hypothetical protein
MQIEVHDHIAATEPRAFLILVYKKQQKGFSVRGQVSYLIPIVLRRHSTFSGLIHFRG